jgi:hypothetical protein
VQSAARLDALAGESYNRVEIQGCGMRRRAVAVGLIALVVLLAIYSAYWWIVAERFPSIVADWAAERRKSGWQVDYRIDRVEGFPFSLRSEIRTTMLAGPGSPPRWTWQGPTIAVHTRPWRLGEVEFEFPGRHRLTLPVDGTPLEFEATADSARGSMVFGGGSWPRVKVEFGGVGVVSSAQPGPTTVKSIVVSLSPNPAPNRPAGEAQTESPRLAITALGAVLPEAPRPIFGREIERFDLDATWVGRLPSGPLSQALAAWRDGGGTIEVAKLRLKWGKLDIDGAGTFALDSEQRPLAASNVRLQGYGQALDDLAKAGVVRGRDAIAARLMMGLLARSGRTGKDEVTVSITVQDGWFNVGPARLFRVPPIAVD